MTPQQAKRAVSLLLDAAKSCEWHVERGEYDGKKHDENALRYFRDCAAAYRAAIVVLEAHAQPVRALPPLDADGLTALDRYDARAA